MRSIVAGQEGSGESLVVYEGFAGDLPGVEPSVADLAAIEVGVDIQERLERLDVLEVPSPEVPVDEVAVRRGRRARRRVLRAEGVAA